MTEHIGNVEIKMSFIIKQKKLTQVYTQVLTSISNHLQPTPPEQFWEILHPMISSGG
jgi:hypothetical protein